MKGLIEFVEVYYLYLLTFSCMFWTQINQNLEKQFDIPHLTTTVHNLHPQASIVKRGNKIALAFLNLNVNLKAQERKNLMSTPHE